MIELRGLTVTYKGKYNDTTALKDINLHIDEGDIVVFIGPSGCGKSTLLHVLSGIINNYEGWVLIDGAKINPKEHSIGLILQNYGLLPWKNVIDNIYLSRKIKGSNQAKAECSETEHSEGEYAEKIINKLELNSLLKKYPKELSGGQKQRVAIARSFIQAPDILLMDEPFSALDAITREEAQELFLSLWREKKVSTVFITHSIEEAVCLGRKIIILSPSPGRILKIIENPVFGIENLRLNDEYYKMLMDLRKFIKEEW